MNDLLKELRDKKLLRDIDVYFASNISASFGAPEGELLFALTLHATASGNTCLDTSATESIAFYTGYKEQIDTAVSILSDMIDKGVIAKAPSMNAPFILKGSKLYLKSFYTDESAVSNFISESASTKYIVSDAMRRSLDKYFTEKSMQKAAAMNSAMNRFSVISGGPGTGKTRTVFRLLAVLCESSQHPLRIAVCAPTGKAASRLSDSILEQRAGYINEPFISQIPEQAHTVHRLLGMYGDRHIPLYNSDNKLPYDIIIVDEASMVDISMMAKLASATRDECRLILLGDKDQLASVQPGAVLGDVCSASPVDSYTPERLEALSAHTESRLTATANRYADITIMLDKSYRYDSDAGIGLLARASGDGDYETAMSVLTDDSTGRVRYIEYSDSIEDVTGEMILDQFRKYKDISDPQRSIDTFNEFRILSPHRKLAGGTDHLNAIAAKTLFRAGYHDNTKPFYHGMPLMITENDYSLRLYNGETGLVMNCDGLKACFNIENTIRKITPTRLPEHTPAYAMTVHKSQGSEFRHVLFILPETDSPILTRELFYTAVTRAKEKLTVITTPKAVELCLSRRIKRSSGLSL